MTSAVVVVSRELTRRPWRSVAYPGSRLCPSRNATDRYGSDMGRNLIQRIHNPHNRQCECDPDCWCQRTVLGRAVKWWFPGRYVGLHHKNPRTRSVEEEQAARRATGMEAASARGLTLLLRRAQLIRIRTKHAAVAWFG